MCYEIRVTSLDTRVTSSNLQVTSSNPQVASSNRQVPNSKPRVTSSNRQVRRLKAQVSRLKHELESELVTREYEVVTRRYKLATGGFTKLNSWIWTRKFQLVLLSFQPVTSNQFVTLVFPYQRLKIIVFLKSSTCILQQSCSTPAVKFFARYL